MKRYKAFSPDTQGKRPGIFVYRFIAGLALLLSACQSDPTGTDAANAGDKQTRAVFFPPVGQVINGQNGDPIQAALVDVDQNGFSDGLDFDGDGFADMGMSINAVNTATGVKIKGTDIDGDGRIDYFLAIGPDGTVEFSTDIGDFGDDLVILSRQPLNYELEIPLAESTSNTGSAFVDNDGDGQADLVDTNRDGSSEGGLLLVATDPATGANITGKDLNGDGEPDYLLMVNPDGTISFYTTLAQLEESIGNSVNTVSEPALVWGDPTRTAGNILNLPTNQGFRQPVVLADTDQDNQPDGFRFTPGGPLRAAFLPVSGTALRGLDFNNDGNPDGYLLLDEQGAPYMNSAPDGQGSDLRIIRDAFATPLGIDTSGNGEFDIYFPPDPAKLIPAGAQIQIKYGDSQVNMTSRDRDGDGTPEGLDLDGDGVADARFAPPALSNILGLDQDEDGVSDFFLIKDASGQYRLNNWPDSQGANLRFATDGSGNITGVDIAGDGSQFQALARSSQDMVTPTTVSLSPPSIVLNQNLSMTPITAESDGNFVLYSVSPDLPNGLSLDPISGRVSGTPTSSLVTTDFTITATNNLGSSNATLQITINEAPVSDSLPTPVIHYQIDESAGDSLTTLLNTGTGGQSGSVSGGVSWAADHAGNNQRALFLDGVDDNITVSGFTGISGTNSRTISVWVKTENNFAGDGGIYIICVWGSQVFGQQWKVYINDDTGLGKPGAVGVGVWNGRKVGQTVVADGRWHHIAVTWEDDGSPDISDAVLYIDGQPDTFSSDQSQTVNTDSAGDVVIGSSGDGNNYFRGKLHDFRIYDQVLGADAVKRISARVPTGLLAWYPLDGNADDYSGQGLDGVVYLADDSADRYGRSTAAYDFDDSATDQKNITSAPVGGSAGLTDASISIWFKMPGDVAGNHDYLISRDAAGTNPGDFSIRLNASTGKLEAIDQYNGVSLFSAASLENDTNWHHVLFTLDATNGYKLYIDGTLEDSYATTGNTIWNNNENLTLGRGSSGDKNFRFTGLLDDVRIYDRALTAGELQALIFEPDRNLVAYFPLDGNGRELVAENNATAYNGVTATTDQSGLASGAVALNLASSQYLKTGSNTGISGTTPRTLTFRSKAVSTTVTSIEHQVAWGPAVDYQTFGTFTDPFTNNIFFYGHGTGLGDIDTGTGQSTNWEFWAVTFDGVNVAVYKNGNLVSQEARALNTVDGPLYIGAKDLTGSPTSFYNGSLDEVRLYDRVLPPAEISTLASGL